MTRHLALAPLVLLLAACSASAGGFPEAPADDEAPPAGRAPAAPGETASPTPAAPPSTPAAPSCTRVVECTDAAFDPGPARAWVHGIISPTVTGIGSANHRGRDMVLTPSDTQWVLGKIAYGAIDKDLKDEDVDVWVQRDCGARWEKLGTTRTTSDGAHATV